ncbi:hypothetical protein DW064_12880, partial [Segatella copri]
KHAPCKGKSFKILSDNKLLPLQGVLLTATIPRALPWARSFCPFRAYGAYLVWSLLTKVLLFNF